MTGKGSVNHNSRKFHDKNTDPERSCLNVEYCNENLKDVYHELFDEALARYNEKQTWSDRRIDDYYEKIRSGKQEKPFHEIIQFSKTPLMRKNHFTIQQFMKFNLLATDYWKFCRTMIKEKVLVRQALCNLYSAEADRRN